MNTMPDYNCPKCGEEMVIVIPSFVLRCLPCFQYQQEQEMTKLREWNAWARDTTKEAP